MMVGGIVYGLFKEEQWGVQVCLVDFFDVKGDVEFLLWLLQVCFEWVEYFVLYLGCLVCIVLNGCVVGWIGELYLCWLQKYDLVIVLVVWEVELDVIIVVGLLKYCEVLCVLVVMCDIVLVVCQDVVVQVLVDMFEKVVVGILWQCYLQGVVLFDEFCLKVVIVVIGVQEKSFVFRIML